MRQNTIFERARFNRRYQQERESAEAYITELYRLSENCKYGDLRDEMIRDRLVVGIRNQALSQQLQMDPELTLERAKKRIRQQEAVKDQQRQLTNREETQLDEVRFRGRQPKLRPDRGDRRDTNAGKTRNGAVGGRQAGKPCGRCGKGAHPKEKCPAKDAICYKCRKKGHYGAQCLSKNVEELTNGSGQSNNSIDYAFLDTVSSTKNSVWLKTVQVNGRDITFKLDTGAEVSAILTEAYEILLKPPLTPPGKRLFGPSRQPLDTAGEFQAEISCKGKSEVQPIYVVKGLKKNLLGLPAITALQLAVRIDATSGSEGADQKTAILQKFPAAFQGLGNLGEEFEIYLKPDAKPYSLYTPRHVPLPLRQKVQEELNRMETIGVISKVDKPTPWCAGMVVVLKKGGDIRICVDLKPLNESVLREVHPLPKVDETLAQISGATVFTKLDANSGFCKSHWPKSPGYSPPSSLLSGVIVLIKCHLESPVHQNISRRG